jgi:hypothetical protein
MKIEFELIGPCNVDAKVLTAFAYLGAKLANQVYSDVESCIPAKGEELLDDTSRLPDDRKLLRSLILWAGKYAFFAADAQIVIAEAAHALRMTSDEQLDYDRECYEHDCEERAAYEKELAERYPNLSLREAYDKAIEDEMRPKLTLVKTDGPTAEE